MILSQDKSSKSFWSSGMAAILIALLTFSAMAPTLKWPEFNGGNENIIVQTALEMHHGGPILVPQMIGEPRIKKPPLVAWITALSMRPDTIRQLDDPRLRQQAYLDLEWQVRWTGLFAGCLLILVTYDLGRVLYDARIGIFAAMAVATNILFQKYMRQSTSDVHLALWVTIANLCYARALLTGKCWLFTSLAALATAIAFLCKGPVAIVESFAPAAAMFFIAGGSIRKIRIPLVLVSIGLFALIALPWFIHVYLTVPNVMQTWFSEVSRHGATDLEPSNPGMYLLIVPLFFPWVVMLISGLVVMMHEKLRSDWHILIMLVLPLAIMVWFPDRKERYMLPLIAPAAIICARGIKSLIDAPLKDAAAKLATIIHYVVLASVCVCLPIAASKHPLFSTADGKQWFEPKLAIWFSIVMACVIGLGILIHFRKRQSLVISTYISMLILQAILMYGYRNSENGKSAMKPMADYIRFAAPDASVYDWNPNGRRVDTDLPIYLNRTVTFADPKTLKMTGRSVVYVTRQSGDDFKNGIEPQPPADAGWMLLTKVRERKNHWWAFILPSPAIQQ